MANVEHTPRMIPFITCEISLGQYVCKLVLGVNVFDLDIGVQIDSIEQPIKRNSVGPGKHVSLSGFFPFMIILCPQTHTTKLLDVEIGRLREHI